MMQVAALKLGLEVQIGRSHYCNQKLYLRRLPTLSDGFGSLGCNSSSYFAQTLAENQKLLNQLARRCFRMTFAFELCVAAHDSKALSTGDTAPTLNECRRIACFSLKYRCWCRVEFVVPARLSSCREVCYVKHQYANSNHMSTV